MEYRENSLTYDEYYRLRESVGWNNFCKEQVITALKNSVYDITVRDNNQVIGMGRLIGDGIYYTIVDVVVDPAFQGKKVGTEIINRLLEFIEKNIPTGGRASVQLIAAEGKEAFYEKQGFKKIPHENCGSGMRRVIYK